MGGMPSQSRRVQTPRFLDHFAEISERNFQNSKRARKILIKRNGPKREPVQRGETALPSHALLFSFSLSLSLSFFLSPFFLSSLFLSPFFLSPFFFSTFFLSLRIVKRALPSPVPM